MGPCRRPRRRARRAAPRAARTDRQTRAQRRRCKLQVAGGFRERDQIARMLDAGVGRVVIGSLAVNEPETRARLARRIRQRTGSRWRSTSASSTARRWSPPPAGPRTSAAACGTSPRSTRGAAPAASPTSAATACSQGPNVELLAEAVRAPSAPRSPGIGRRRVARRPARALRDAPARSSARRCGKAASTSRRRSTCRRARIIPCLDVSDGRVVKGVQFRDHRDVGDIVEHALRYRDEGADELVFYDITRQRRGPRPRHGLGAADRAR